MRHGLLDAAALQRMLYDALDQSDDIVVVLELDAGDLVVAAANDAFCRATGCCQPELIGRSFAAIAANCAAVIRAAEDGQSIRTELLCGRKDGRSFWFGLHLMPVKDAARPRFVVLGRDITESQQVRQQQAAIQGLLAKVFMCVKAPVAIVTDTGTVQMSNPALEEMLGYPPGGLVGKSSVDFVSTGSRAAVLAARERQMEDGCDYTVAAHLLRADGSDLSADISSVMVQRDDLRRFRIITALSRTEPALKLQVAGKIRLVGLDDVKTVLGTRWPAVAARAMASAEHIVQRRCGPRDTYARAADGGFIICFADATESEAAFRAAAMAREIRTRLIGEGEAEATAHVSAVTAAVEVPATAGETADTLAAIIGERLNSRLAQIETRARETLREAMHTVACCIEPIHSRRRREIAARFVKLPREQEQNILAAYSSLPMQERQGFDFDRLVLGAAADAIVTEIAKGESQLVLVNVDFEVFLHRQRTERYVAACQALDPRLRERLILVLSGMPRGFPGSRVLECVTRLRPFCHGVGFQSDGMEAPPVDYSLLGGAIIVLPVDGWAVHDGAQLGKLAKLVDSLHAHQARVLVRHVGSWDDVKSLARANVDLVSMREEERET